MASSQVQSAAAATDAFPYTLTMRIPFPTARLARTALRALAVDAELSPLVRRSLSLASPDTAISANDTASHVLVAHYAATTNRMLRVATNGFLESARVVLACMRELDGVEAAAAPWSSDADDKDEEMEALWSGSGARAVAGLEKVQGLQEMGALVDGE